MKYTFDETGDHRQDGSIRWEQPEGRDDIIGMGTADMDFTCAPCIRKVLQPICEENTYNYRFKPESYFQSVIRWFRENYQLNVKKDWMSNVPGKRRLCIDAYTLLHSAQKRDRGIRKKVSGKRYEASGWKI